MREKAFTLRIDGPGLTPADIPISVLAEVASLLETALGVYAAAEVSLSIDKVTDGSGIFSVCAPSSAIPAVVSVAKAMRAPRAELPPVVSVAFDALESLMRKTRWRATVVATRDREARGSIGELPEEEKRGPHFLTGPTSLFGTVVAVGGAGQATAKLRVLSGDLQLVSVTQAEAKKLGELLYQEVGIDVEAEWEVSTLAMTSARMTRLLPFREGPIAETLEKLRQLANGAFDGVDAMDLVRSMRGDD